MRILQQNFRIFRLAPFLLCFFVFITQAQTKLSGVQCGLEPSKRADFFKMPVLDTGGNSWQITNDFGNRVTNKDIPGLPGGFWQHTGVDYLLGGSSSASQNQPIYSIGNGIVIFSTKSNPNPLPTRGGLVIIKHLAPRGSKFIAFRYNGKAGSYEEFETEEIFSYYLHLDESKILVKTGDNIDAGGKIAELYDKQNKKYTYVPHLHFEIWSVCSNSELNGYEPDGRLKNVLKNPVIDPISFLSNVRIKGGTIVPPVTAAELPTMFLLDVSGSMEENGKILQAKNAGLEAVREMQENRRRKQDNSTVSIWTFGGECTPRDVKQLLPFTNNLSQAENIFLRGITPPAGATPLFTAINLSVDRMTDYLAARPQLGEGRIVVLTDGMNTCNDKIRPRGVYSQSQNIVYQKIKFLCIGFDIKPGSQEERDLQYLASSSGGKYFPARDSEQLRRAFQKVIRVYQPKVSNNESGTRAIVNRDFGNALQIWTIYVKNNPSDPIGYYNLAMVCEALERPKCATENYLQYLKLLANAPDSSEVGRKVTTLEVDYRSQFIYYIDVLRSDLAYLKEYYKRLTSLKNAELAAEFAGFVAEKGIFYRNLMTILEIRSPRIERNTTDLADSLDFLNRRVNSPSFDRDALSLLTIPIGHLEELIERLDDYKTKNL